MIFYLLDVILVSLFIIFNEITYNSTIRESFNLQNFLKFLAGLIISGSVSFYIFLLIPLSINIPFLGKIIGYINNVSYMFYNYLPKALLILWFIVPLVLAWIFYIIRSGIYHLIKKKEYYDWKNKKREQESKKNEVIEPVVEPTIEPVAEPNIEVESEKYKLDLLGNSITPFSVETLSDFSTTVQLAQKNNILISNNNNKYQFFIFNKTAYLILKEIANANHITDFPDKPSYFEIEDGSFKNIIGIRPLQEKLKEETYDRLYY